MNNIASERRRLSMSQEELAAHLGVTRETLSKWENGAPIPSDKLISMGVEFNCAIDYLLGRVEERTLAY